MQLNTFLECLVSSFEHWTKQALCPAGKTPIQDELDQLPFVILSHGIEKDPILNYGNQTALNLWETDFASFTQMPSRLTAEPINQKSRAEFISKVTQNGYVDDYQGIRISCKGKRFFIEKATVWNVLDQQQNYIGQAATFKNWNYL